MPIRISHKGRGCIYNMYHTVRCMINYTGTGCIILLVVALQKMAGKSQAKGSLKVSYTERGDSYM